MINFRKEGLNRQKSQIWIGPKIPTKCMNLCMKHENKFNISSNPQNLLEHRVSNKTLKNLKKPLVQFVRNWPIDHHIS